ncbi:MAG: type III pantothenate kinase [Candidatus Eremiobacteraeota bacterium]|nr:type III pantothenate kinase [Candidatus Eremiobacteraeota bacterium]
MLMCLDVGNTNIVMGIFDGKRLLGSFRFSTERNRTADEIGVVIKNLLSELKIAREQVEGIIIASVVPPLDRYLVEMCNKYFGHEPLMVGPGIKTGMPIRTDNPREVGADLIAGSIAAYELYGKKSDEHSERPVIIIDFGTATTFGAVSAFGEYLGVAIAPGIQIAADALFSRAAKLLRVDLVFPDSAIGKNTVQSMQAGLTIGFLGLIEKLIIKIKAELGPDTFVVATGGLAGLMADKIPMIDTLHENLVMEGLRIIYGRNN